MKAQIVVTLDGEIQVITREGNFEEGRLAIEQLLATLKAQGVNVELDGPVEQHRHDDAGQVRRQVEAK